MPNRTPAMLAGLLTIVLLMLCGVLSVFVQMIALNGASERQGVSAMVISLLCQGAGAILIAIFTSRLTNFFLAKFSWNTFLAVTVAIISGTVVGVIIAILATVIAIPLAGIR